MGSFLISVVTSLIPTVASTVTKHVAYPFKVGNNIRDLESAVRGLVALKKDLMTGITNAEREHGVPTESVKEWLTQVEKIETEAEHIMTDYRQRSRCLWNHFADIFSNYKISKRAAKKQAEVKTLCQKKMNLKDTIPMPPPLAQEMPASSSKSPNLQLALDYVHDDAHNIIGIWGKGGIGKTHLLNQVNNELCKDRAIFNVVIFVMCSQDCSEEKVQDVIINKLGLKKNPESKQSTIFKFLKERSFVVLLDDLWSRVDLDKVGIPNPIDTRGAGKRKVILTTRSKDVCRDMEVQKYIKVDGLKWDQAWSLFVNKVTEDTINSHPLIAECAKEVAEELGGLPLALITVGRAMHDKENLSDWEYALKQLKQAQMDDVEHSKSNKSVFHTLSFSYENLRNDALKECFLHCSLWPEDHCIHRDELVELWMGLGLIDEPDIHSAYNLGYTYIGNLLDVCLLEEVKQVKHSSIIFGENLYVKLHDVIRDMALWIENGRHSRKNKWIVKAGTYKDSTGISVSCETEKLSLMHNESVEFSLSCTPGSPKLSTLLLNNNRLMSDLLWLELFTGLIVLDLSYNKLDQFPIEICKLLELQFLNLSGNYIQSLPGELAALINLKYLLLRKNNSIAVPRGILSKLKALRVLDLFDNPCSAIDWDEIKLFSTVLKEINSGANFQALGIAVFNMQEFLKLNENKNIPIRWLNVSIPYTESLTFSDSFFGNSQMQTNLFFLLIEKISTNAIHFESKPGSAHRLKRLQQLAFRWCYAKHILWKNLKPKDVLSRLQILEFEKCQNLVESISWVVYLPSLQQLKLDCCNDIKQLVDEEYVVKNNGEMDASCPTFPSLKMMDLFFCRNMENICDPKITFPVLEVMTIQLCNRLRKLPFKADNIPPKLRQIKGEKSWWDQIEWEDSSLKTSLQPFFVKYNFEI